MKVNFYGQGLSALYRIHEIISGGVRFIMRIFNLIAAVFLIFLSAVPVSAQSAAEKSFLTMYFTDEELVVVSATRSLQSITRVAENISVVTKEDIELMNAHTLSDVLNTVTGVQLDIKGGIGAIAFPLIQGSDYRHVAVLMDGVLINSNLQNLADISMMPVQHVEKIEIIKGPASSVWGSSLGGVVNIITKSGAEQKRNGGTVSGSFGEQTSLDSRAEMYGRKERTAYYLYAGRMQFDGFNGLSPNNGTSNSNLYLKLSQELTKDSQLVLTTFYNKGERDLTYPGLGFYRNQEIENLFSSLSLNSSLGNDIGVALSVRYVMRDLYQNDNFDDGSIWNTQSRDNSHGASAKINWKKKDHAMVAGIDYDNTVMKNSESFTDNTRFRIEKLALFANDTITIGKLTVTPGVRYDRENTFGDFISPSLGLTYELYDKTVVRAAVARGFSSVPAIYKVDTIYDFGDGMPWYYFKGNSDLKPEKVWSYQLGIETGIFEYFWLKTSLFRHDISDAIIAEGLDPFTFVNRGKIRRQGVEAEIKTKPFYHVTLSAGATYIDVKDLITDETIPNVPKSACDISLKYDDEKSLKALLTGHYIWFDSNSIGGKYNSFIVGFNMIKKVYDRDSRRVELFLTAHNLFNGEQHSNRFVNPNRWVEAGLRVKF